MTSNNQLKQINDKLISLMRDLMTTGNWEDSLFLRTAHKKLEELTSQAMALSKQLDSSHLDPSQKHKNLPIEGYISVFVSLYQFDAYNLVKWGKTLKNIKDYSVNRPIYRIEEHVQEMLRSKQGSAREAYVSIYVKESDLIPPYTGKIAEDRFGHELLTLREGSLSSENIIKFVHLNKSYTFENESLILKNENDL